MKNTIKYLFVVVLISTFNHAVAQKNDGPFGVQMGMSLEEIKSNLPKEAEYHEENESMFSYHAPSSVEIIDGGYFFMTTSETGLCRVAGMTKETDRESSVVSTYNILKKALTDKYGKPKIIENNANKSLGLIPALSMERAIHGSFWGDKLPGDFKEIALEILPSTKFNTAKVRVLYDFKNSKKCFEIINNRRTQGL